MEKSVADAKDINANDTRLNVNRFSDALLKRAIFNSRNIFNTGVQVHGPVFAAIQNAPVASIRKGMLPSHHS